MAPLTQRRKEKKTQRKKDKLEISSILSLCALLCLTGCSYKWSSSQDLPSLSVSYIQGDEDGSLTAEVIRTLSASRIAQVIPGRGTLQLQVTLTSSQNQTIGYRRDKQKISGEIKKNIVSREGRKSLSAEISLIERTSQKVVFGPYTVTAESDYDYVDGDSIQDLSFVNSKGLPTTVLPFSLGQLEPIEAAQEATTKPLYRNLAQKMKDALTMFFK